MADHKGREFLGLLLLLGLASANVLISAQLIGQKGIVKTIQIENGDVVDCIDIDRQPALDHPLLKDHIVQTSPGSYVKVPKGNKEENHTRKGSFFDRLASGEECPEGSVPILRTTREQTAQRPPKASPVGGAHNVDVNIRKYSTRIDEQNFTGYEYAVVSANYGNYYGAQASLNVWHPLSNPGEHSLAEIWLISGGYNGILRNTIEAGWLVDSRPNLSRETRLFTYWTADNYQHTGCYNLECPGFVQVNQKMFPGVPLRPISVYGGAQDEIDISISKDNVTGNWWLRVDGADVGYWPSNLFSNTLRDSAELVMWGGEIYSSAPPEGHHTATQMGSGHFANESYGRSSHFRNLLPITQPEITPNNISLSEIVTTPTYYTLEQGRNETGIYFYFGGPGYSLQSGGADTNNKSDGIRFSIRLLGTIVLGVINCFCLMI